MQYMHWGPRDLGYRAATQGHIDVIIEIMSEGAHGGNGWEG